MTKKHRKKDVPICQMSFSHLNEYRWRREERLGIAGFTIIEERPAIYFTEEEWHQYFLDSTIASRCIEDDFPIPEDVEIRLLTATDIIHRYFME